MNDIVKLNAVQADTDSRLVIQTFLDLEAGQKIMDSVGDSLYGWLRERCVRTYNEVYAKCKAAGREFNISVVRGKFESELAGWEALMRDPSMRNCISESGKLPRKWINAKSTLCTAMEHDFDFSSDPQIGQSKLANWSKDEKARKEKAAQQKALQEYAEATGEHVKEAPKVDPTTVDPSAPAPAAPASTPAAAPAVATPPASHLSKEQLELISELVSRLDTIAEAGNTDKVDTLLRALDDQSKGQLNKAMAKLGRKAA
jgi:hypothetical protein